MAEKPKYSIGDVVEYDNHRLMCKEYFYVHAINQSRARPFFHEFSFKKKIYYDGETMGESDPTSRYFTNHPHKKNIIHVVNVPEEKLKPLERKVEVQ